MVLQLLCQGGYPGGGDGGRRMAAAGRGIPPPPREPYCLYSCNVFTLHLVV